MIDDLISRSEDLARLNSKLLLIIGNPQSGKTKLLRDFSKINGIDVLNAGATLGHKLLNYPTSQRRIVVNEIFRELSQEFIKRDYLLIDNIEILFDKSLQLNPLDFLKRHAHACCIIAAWPGELRGFRLSYATIGHPEHRDYGIDGLVPFKIH